jgi:aminodeoxychorismate lyase
MMYVVNGRLVPSDQALVSVMDRGFLYGDGLFETIRVYHGVPFCWRQHIERLKRGAGYLKIRLAYSTSELRDLTSRLLEHNQLTEAVIRITLTRGRGPRGYSIGEACDPVLVMSLHPAPELPATSTPGWRLLTSSIRVPTGDPLAQVKSCNKLHQILARHEAETEGMEDALLLNTEGQVTETTSANLFWLEDDTVCTAPVDDGLLPGVTREFVLDLCSSMRIPTRETSALPQTVLNSGAVFLTLSTLELVEVTHLDSIRLKRSPVVTALRRAYREVVEEVTRLDSYKHGPDEESD